MIAFMTAKSSVFGALLDEKNFRAGRNLSDGSGPFSSLGEEWTLGREFSMALGLEEHFAKMAKHNRLAK